MNYIIYLIKCQVLALTLNKICGNIYVKNDEKRIPDIWLLDMQAAKI